MKTIKSLSIFILIYCLSTEGIREELWWQNALENTCTLNDFQTWLGDINAPSRVIIRNYIRDKGYNSILDAACGLCIDYYGFKQDNIKIKYTGIDVTDKLVARALNQNIPVIKGSIDCIPYEDNSFDISYGRHILEHLAGYESAINELIRVAKQEATIIFFLKPEESRSENYISSELSLGSFVFFNKYSMQKITEFILKNKKVSSILWQDVPNTQDSILHIYLK